MNALAPKFFYWVHIPTGIKGQTEFSLYHAAEIGCRGFFSMHGHFPMTAAVLLINKWNASAPSDWKYWL